ncbi:sigma factor [Nocardioides zeicaulis]
MTLEDLLERSGNQDTAAFATMYDRLAPRVYGLVTCLVRDPDAAEQVCCEAFLEVWRRAATYDPASPGAAAWVLGIAHRVALRAAGLTRLQADALHLARFDGLDHRSIDAHLGAEDPATTLLTSGLRRLAAAGGR